METKLKSFLDQASQGRTLLRRQRLGVREELVVEVKGGLHAYIIQISVPMTQAPESRSVRSGVESREGLGSDA
jgi:hypothetical protein